MTTSLATFAAETLLVAVLGCAACTSNTSSSAGGTGGHLDDGSGGDAGIAGTSSAGGARASGGSVATSGGGQSRGGAGASGRASGGGAASGGAPSDGGAAGNAAGGSGGPDGGDDAGGTGIDEPLGRYLGVTCGWQYSAQLTGPLTYPNQRNISLYNPDPNDPDATWDSWAEQLAQAGVDFVCPNLTGSNPHSSDPPSHMAPLLAAFKRRGLDRRIKFAIFDDNAASWCAEWNLAHDRGYGYAQPMDIGDPENYKYLYDYNYKIFYDTIPDANRFKIDGRPVIIIWSGSGTFITNAQGNLSKALRYVRQKCQADFGFDPYIVGNEDFIKADKTCADKGVLDATHRWFGPPSDPYTVSTFNGTRVGVAVAEFQHPGQNGYLDPKHGKTFDDGLEASVGSGSLLTLCEGFTDYEEDAAMFRARNMDANGSALSYDQTEYDYPNQRLALLRAHSRDPFPVSLKFEAEGCDTFGGASGGNGKMNYYRNGNIAIEPTNDAMGGHHVGFMQSGEWFEWQHVPLNGQPRFEIRVATSGAGHHVHVVLDGQAQQPSSLPDTGGYQTWATVDLGGYGSFQASYHTVRFVFDDGGANFNYWQTNGGTRVPLPPLP